MIKKDQFEMGMSISEDNKNVVKSLISYSSLGLEMGLSVAIGIGIGYFLDRYFNTSPYLTVIFMVFGVVAAFKTIFMLLKKVNKKDERNGSR